MKLKVLTDFKDKYTGELYKAGKVLEVEAERGAEMLSNELQLVEKVIERKAAKKSATK